MLGDVRGDPLRGFPGVTHRGGGTLVCSPQSGFFGRASLEGLRATAT
ncbi:hypothetical protein AKJ09_03770 [Labilithrix luteola]|uniref:Uncharacterized protein n=1 Tax=Labilithrix luteola TaxID=1391654 RepID=A0A0K1PUQ0_9BACT|nr:hypothetical protein AKJ09_03770 [Labilithrix luteola]